MCIVYMVILVITIISDFVWILMSPYRLFISSYSISETKLKSIIYILVFVNIVVKV